MSSTRAAAPDKLERGAMGVMDIVFFVLAGVAPMGVVVALTVLAIALGNGAGVPGTYLVAGIVLALFAIGYVRMSRARHQRRRVLRVRHQRTRPPRRRRDRVHRGPRLQRGDDRDPRRARLLRQPGDEQRRRDRPAVAGMGRDRVRDRCRPVLLRGHPQREGARPRAAVRGRDAARVRRRRAGPQRLSRFLAGRVQAEHRVRPRVRRHADARVRVLRRIRSHRPLRRGGQEPAQSRSPAPPTSRSRPSRCSTS